MASQFIRFPSASGQTFDTNAGVTTANTLRTVIVTDQTSIPVTATPSALDFGASAAAGRVAALLGNTTGQADFGSGAAGAQTLRAVISTRSEGAATPLSARLSDGAAFYQAPTTAQIPATLGQKVMASSLAVVIASDQSTLPVSFGFLDFGASAAALRTAALLGNATGAADFNFGAGGTQTLRVASLVGNSTGGADFGSGAAGAQTLRAVISTRSEAAATPLSARLSDGAAFYQAPTTAQVPTTLGQKTMANSLAVVIASDQSTVPVQDQLANVSYTDKGKIVGSALTGAYATVLTLASVTRCLFIINSCDQTILVSLDGGVTAAFELESGESVSIDLATDKLKLPATTAVQAKHNGVVPTNGSIRVSAIG